MRIHFVWPFGFPFSCGSTSPATSYRPAISRLVNSELSDLRRSRPSLMSGTIYSIQVGVNPVQIYIHIYTSIVACWASCCTLRVCPVESRL
jgi:hypothetical protein